jgi:hypothetical protein
MLLLIGLRRPAHLVLPPRHYDMRFLETASIQMWAIPIPIAKQRKAQSKMIWMRRIKHGGCWRVKEHHTNVIRSSREIALVIRVSQNRNRWFLFECRELR